MPIDSHEVSSREGCRTIDIEVIDCEISHLKGRCGMSTDRTTNNENLVLGFAYSSVELVHKEAQVLVNTHIHILLFRCGDHV